MYKHPKYKAEDTARKGFLYGYKESKTARIGGFASDAALLITS